MTEQETHLDQIARIIQQRRIYERWHSERYRGEREHYPEWVDFGGEGGEA